MREEKGEDAPSEPGAPPGVLRLPCCPQGPLSVPLDPLKSSSKCCEPLPTIHGSCPELRVGEKTVTRLRCLTQSGPDPS